MRRTPPEIHSETFERIWGEAAEKGALTTEEKADVLFLASVLKSCGIPMLDYLSDVAISEVALRSRPGFLVEDLPGLLREHVWDLMYGWQRHRGKVTYRTTGGRQVVADGRPDPFLAPSFMIALRHLRAERFGGAKVDILDDIADVIAVRLTGGRGRSPRSLAARLVAIENLKAFKYHIGLFRVMLKGLPVDCRSEKQIAEHFEGQFKGIRTEPIPENDPEWAAIVKNFQHMGRLVEGDGPFTRQLAAYQRERGRRGRLSPSDRAALGTLELMRIGRGDKRPVTDDDLLEIQRLVAKWKDALKKQRQLGARIEGRAK